MGNGHVFSLEFTDHDFLSFKTVYLGKTCVKGISKPIIRQGADGWGFTHTASVGCDWLVVYRYGFAGEARLLFLQTCSVGNRSLHHGLWAVICSFK